MQGPNNEPVDSAFGQFQIPYPQMPAGADSSSTYIAAPWVGLLDEAGAFSTDSGVIVQAGVLIEGTNGAFSVQAWWEWYPQPYQFLPDFPVAFGDTISISVTMTSSGTANIVITNQSQHQQTTIPAQGPASSLDKAGFVVEDINKYPFLDFGRVTFSGCRAIIGGNQLGFDSISGELGLSNGKASGSISGSDVLVVTYNT